MAGKERMEELVKRCVSLGFAAVYLHRHGSQRGSALRVAHLAYRFLDGEDVESINSDADCANTVREAPRQKTAGWKAAAAQLKQLRKLRRPTHG